MEYPDRNTPDIGERILPRNDVRPRRNCDGTLNQPEQDAPPTDAGGIRRMPREDAMSFPSPNDQPTVTDRGIQNRADDARDERSGQPPEAQRPQSTDQSGIGRLIFRVTTARGAIPLEGARVTVRRYIDEGMNGGVGVPDGGDTYAVLYSGADGKTQTLSLPTPAAALSLQAGAPDAPLPYALYNAEVSLDSYYVQNYSRIPLFDNITSVQQADLIPLPENGTDNGLTPDDNRFTEGQNPEL